MALTRRQVEVNLRSGAYRVPPHRGFWLSPVARGRGGDGPYEKRKRRYCAVAHRECPPIAGFGYRPWLRPAVGKALSLLGPTLACALLKMR